MKLMESFGIRHSVLYDKDGSKNQDTHEQPNWNIKQTQNSHMHAIEGFKEDLEAEFGLESNLQSYEKPMQILEKWAYITKDENYKKVEEMILGLLPESKKNSVG